MDYEALLQKIKKGGLVGRRFQREGHRKFRDCVTLYRDGRMLFQRFCYGEAAGLVFSLWADAIAPDGAIAWNGGTSGNSAEKEAPKRFTSVEDALHFDDKADSWLPVADLKSDPKNGYGRLRSLFLRMKK